jgi:hypothetical protein
MIPEEFKIYERFGFKRYSLFIVSEEFYEELEDKYKELNNTNESLKSYGFISNISICNIPIIHHTDVVDKNIVCIEKDLVKALIILK